MDNIPSNLFEKISGIIKIFEYAIEPKEDEIIELSEDLYEKLKQSGNYDASLKWYVWLSVTDPTTNEVCIMNEKERNSLFIGRDSIERYAVKSGQIFDSYVHKLEYVSKRMPDEFSVGTRFAQS